MGEATSDIIPRAWEARCRGDIVSRDPSSAPVCLTHPGLGLWATSHTCLVFGMVELGMAS